MHTTLTGLEYGLFGYWTFDECAGGRLRDRLGKHDGVMHGGRWLRSTVAIRTNQEIVHCPTKGKCSIDEVIPHECMRGRLSLVGSYGRWKSLAFKLPPKATESCHLHFD